MTKSDPTVLHIIQQLTRGGASRAMITAAEAARQIPGLGCHRIVSLLPADPVAAQLAHTASLELVDAPSLHEICGAISAADLVHLHFWNTPELYELLQIDWPPARLVIQSHVSGHAPPQVIPHSIVALADHLLVATPYSLTLPVFGNIQHGADSIRVGVLYDVADLTRLDGLCRQTHQGFRVGYIGTVDFAKLHPDFIAMCAAVRVPGIQFEVCGAGSAFATLRRQAEAMGITDRFIWRGYVEDIGECLATYDVFGYPLCDDNYGATELVLQEAMAAGVPPVVLGHGAIPWLVEHNSTGLIVATGAEYSAALERLYHEPAERERLAANARARVGQTFCVATVGRQLHDVYTELMKQPKKQRTWQPSATVLPSGTSPRQAVPLPAVDLFLAALDGTASHFIASREAQDDETLREADAQIAQSSPVMCSPAAGGILHYRRRFPHDSFLRFWSGLALEAQGRHVLALAEYVQAAALGFPHPRLHRYIVRAASTFNVPPPAYRHSPAWRTPSLGSELTYPSGTPG